MTNETNAGRDAIPVAVTSEGDDWAIGNAKKVSKRSGQNLVDVGSTGRDMSAGQTGKVFVIGLSQVQEGYWIKKYILGCWSQISGGGVAIVAYGNDASTAFINNMGSVMEF